MPDGRQVAAAGSIRACTDGFVVGILGAFARYRNGTRNYLADPAQPLATLAPAKQFKHLLLRRQPVVRVIFLDGVGVGAFAGSQYREIQDLQQLTPDVDLLSVSQLLINDDGAVYILGANDRGEEVLYRGTPVQ